MSTVEKRTSFLQVPNVFFETCALPDSAQMLFMRMGAYLGKHHQTKFTGSIRQLSNVTRMSKSTVDRMLKLLVSAKLVTITNERGIESTREVMVITLNMGKLWELNTYHTTVAPVPIWDTELPDCPNVGHNVPSEGQTIPNRDEVSQNEDVTSQVHAQTQDNTFNTDKTNSIPDKKEEPPSLSPDQSLSLSSPEEELKAWLKEAGIHCSKDEEVVKRQLGQLIQHIKSKPELHKLKEFARQQIPGTNKKVFLGNLVSSLDDFLAEQQYIASQSVHVPEITSQSDVEALAEVIQNEQPGLVMSIGEDDYGAYIEVTWGKKSWEFELIRDSEDWLRMKQSEKLLLAVERSKLQSVA